MRNLFLSTLAFVVLGICSMRVNAGTLAVSENMNSGISNADCIGTLSDGTILGFSRSRYNSEACFCGTISHAESVEVPEKVLCDNKVYNVTVCKYSSNDGLDANGATDVVSLTLPATLVQIISVPQTIQELHLKSTSVPNLSSSSSISESTIVYVPLSSMETYTNHANDSHNFWYGNVIRREGWNPTPVTVTVNTPGTFAQALLGQVGQWSDVDVLVVIGKLNDTDLDYLSRLKNVTEMDFSQTDIKSIKGCAGLTFLNSILLPSTVVEVQSEAFRNCRSLKGINIPNVKEIGSMAFSGCTSLTDISFPATTNVGSSAFESCNNLTSVSLPNAASIGSFAFSSCNNLTSVSLPNAASIGSFAFSSCYNLTSVSLPATLLSLGTDAFNGCSRLEDVYCYMVSPLNTTAFSSSGASAATLHVPAISVSSYMLHDNWYSFNKIVALESNIEKINVVSDFAITELKGLVEKANLNVLSAYNDYSRDYIAGHLTVSTNEKWYLGDFVQTQVNHSVETMDGNQEFSVVDINSTIIPYCEISANNVTVKYSAQTGKWNFISFPFDVNVSDIQYPEGTLWVIRKYSGEDRAKMTGKTWQNMTNGMILKAGEGYILHCSSVSSERPLYVEFTFKAVDNDNKNIIFACQDVTKPLLAYSSELAHNRSWNLIGNPYPCFYDTRKIEHNGIITVWNGEGYTAYSLLDDDYVLRPHEAFFVQCPADATSMKFKAEGRQHTRVTSYDVSYAKAEIAANTNHRQVFDLSFSGANYTDKTRFVINESAKLEYEISCDASKFMSSNLDIPQVYIVENGQRMSIDERPLSDGMIALGMYVGVPGDYTIGMQTASAANIILIDKATGKSVNLNNSTYTFSASKGTIDNRFLIRIDNATGLGNVGVNEKSQEPTIFNIGAQKLNAPTRGINIINRNKVLVK